MADFICYCGEVVMSMPGGIRAVADEGYSALQWSCTACSEPRWGFAAGVRFQDAGLTHDHVDENISSYTPGAGESKLVCECGRVMTIHKGLIEFDFVESDDAITDIRCCTCDEVIGIVPEGYRLRMSSGGETICYWPSLKDGDADFYRLKG